MITIIVASMFFMGASITVMYVYKYVPDVWNEVAEKKKEFYQLSLQALEFIKEDLYNSDGTLKEVTDEILEKVENKEQWFLKYFGDKYIETSMLYVSTEKLSDVFTCDISKEFLKWLDK